MELGNSEKLVHILSYWCIAIMLFNAPVMGEEMAAVTTTLARVQELASIPSIFQMKTWVLLPPILVENGRSL